MRLKFKALQLPKDGALYEHNHLVWSNIETLVFNYDGKGGIIVLMDDEIDTLSKQDFLFLLHGGWYELANEKINLMPNQIAEDQQGLKQVISLSYGQLKLRVAENA